MGVRDPYMGVIPDDPGVLSYRDADPELTLDPLNNKKNSGFLLQFSSDLYALN